MEAIPPKKQGEHKSRLVMDVDLTRELRVNRENPYEDETPSLYYSFLLTLGLKQPCECKS